MTNRAFGRREFLGGVTLLAAGLAVPSRALGGLRRSGTYFTWAKLGEGVHATTDPQSGGNVMVVVGEGAALLVDAKFGPMSPVLKREAESFGAPVRHLVNTHHHADHTSGNIGFSANSQIWANVKARDRVLGQVNRYLGELAAGPEALTRTGNPTEPWMLEAAQKLADERHTFEAEDWAPGLALKGAYNEIGFGERSVEIYYVGPGHTDNDVFVKVPDRNIVHAGDLLFNGMHPFFDPAGGGSSKGWVVSLEAVMRVCDDKTVVVPGHGALGDRASLEKAKAYHEQLRDAVAKAIADGKTRDEAVEMSWGFMDGLERDQLRGRAIGFVYDELKAG